MLESLELRRMLAAQPVISEFMAKNTVTIKDGNGNYSDWIEVRNAGDASVNLAGYHLTDDSSKPAKWTFPSVNLPAGAYLLVFADSSGVVDPQGYLHTNFSLSNDGEAMQLTDPSNAILTSFGTNAVPFPALQSDVSYGTANVGKSLVGTGSAVKVLVPKNSTLDGAGSWTQPGFDDSAWTSGTTGVGFDTQAPETSSPTTSTLTGDWIADSLNAAASNSTVSTWSSTVGSSTATKNSAGAPKLVKSVLNGHSVVKFDPTDGTNDQLRVPSASNPMANKTDFTVAVVFTTAAAGAGNADYWYNNSGIVDAEQGGVTNDWGLTINKAGRVGAGLGNTDVTLYTDAGLNNSVAHIAVYTRTGTVTTLTIDNDPTPIVGTGGTGARNAADMVFGSIQTNINYFNGSIAEVRTYNGGLTTDAVRQLSSQLATTYGVTQQSSVIASNVHTNVQSVMAGQATTALIRAPFTVDTSAPLSKMTLNVQYDDGFVAYLNGTEVARRNAPAGTLTYQSTATAQRFATAATTPEVIDLTAYLNLLQGNGATNILSFRALNASTNDPDLLLNPQLVVTAASAVPAFMTTPTPGAANATGYAGIASGITFSKPHGNYTAAFTTDLTAPTAGATLVYTTDGSAPTLTNGTVVAPDNTGFATAHVNITGTTTVRASAFKDGFLPAYITSATYIFVAQTITQPNTAPADAFWGSTAMDTRVTNSSQAYTMTQALTAIPTVSISMSDDDMFGSRGIYFNPVQEGDAWERQGSVEYFDPNNTTDQFSLAAGVRIQGGASRDTSNPKQAFRLFFRSDYGAGELNYPLFPGQTTNTNYDHLVLRATHNYSWANDNSSIADFVRDEYGRELAQKVDGKGLVGKFVQLYVNDKYWGLYNIVEDIDPTWLANNYGGNNDDYDLIEPTGNGGVETKAGDGTGYDSMFNTLTSYMSDGSISNAEYTSLKSLVDVQSVANYMVNVIFRGDRDAPTLIGNNVSPRNFYSYRDHATNAPWKFTVWDGELSMDDVNNDVTERSANSFENPGRLYSSLRTNPEFVQLMTDTVYRVFNNNGPLQVSGSTNNARALYVSIANKINAAVEGESARWGDAKKNATDAPFTRVDWLNEVSTQENSYLVNRSAVVLQQFAADLAPLSVLPATASINGVANDGGTVTAGAILTLTNPNSTTSGDIIYYTTDGTDPRAEGGTPSASAQVYSQPITLTGSRTFNIRILHGGVWSPLKTDAYAISVSNSLHVSELMYNPPAPAAGSPYVADDFEYLELVNTGSSPIDLSSFTFTNGVTLTFASGTIIAPGARAVVAKNAAAFQSRYGTGIQILGTYPDKLSDNGEEVTLVDPANPGTPIFDFTYVAKTAAWFPNADGLGYSLEPINPLAASSALSSPSGWRTSFAVNGSPGVAARFAGTTGDDRYDLRKNATSGNLEIVLNNSDPAAPATYTLVPSAADTLTFDLGAGNDTVNFATNADSIVRTLQFLGGSGTDTLQLASTAAATISATSATVGASTVNFSTIETLSLGSNATATADLNGLNVAVTGGKTTFNTTQHVGSLSIANGASAVLTAGLPVKLLHVGGSLSIDSTSTLDLNDHDMIIDGTDANTLASVGSLIRRAYTSAGNWSGTGLTSTAAKNASPNNKMLGSMTAADYRSIYGAAATFDTESLATGSVIVKYTYFGDADLNGKVDANDYARIDAGFQNQHNAGFVVSWITGDFNYDGKVDANDYALIDGAFQTQGSPLNSVVNDPSLVVAPVSGNSKSAKGAPPVIAAGGSGKKIGLN